MQHSFFLNFFNFFIFIFTLFSFTILYWFCHTLTWIHYGYTWVPNPEPPSHLNPHIISLGHPSAPAPSILYPVSNIELMLLNCGVGEDSWESLGLQGDPASPFWRRSTLGFLWKEWCSSWNSSTLATSCEELTHWKRFWCWEGLGAGGEGDDRGWDGWMASRTQRMWIWVSSGSWWWTGRPGMLRFRGSQTVRHDWATELNWICIC